MREVKCDNTTCQWNKKRKCVLFPGVTHLPVEQEAQVRPLPWRHAA